MGRSGPKLIENFLIPHLDNGTFGEKLRWESRQDKTFLLKWKRKGVSGWVPDDNVVFQEWDRFKNRDIGQDPNKYEVLAKQRFKAALNKIDRIVKLDYGSKLYARYKIVPGHKTRDQELPDESIDSPDTVFSSSPESPLTEDFVKESTPLSDVDLIEPFSLETGNMDVLSPFLNNDHQYCEIPLCQTSTNDDKNRCTISFLSWDLTPSDVHLLMSMEDIE